jgi:hypothetical protein
VLSSGVFALTPAHFVRRLKLEDCIPDVELKQKIDAWITEGHQKGMKGSLAEDSPMEVDDL